MFKMIKVLFFGLFVFVGLYFFGDFRINDTNVKDYLQKHVTYSKLVAIKDGTVQFYHSIVSLFNSNLHFLVGSFF